MRDGAVHGVTVRRAPVGARAQPGSRSTPAAGVPAIISAASAGMIGDAFRLGFGDVRERELRELRDRGEQRGLLAVLRGQAGRAGELQCLGRVERAEDRHRRGRSGRPAPARFAGCGPEHRRAGCAAHVGEVLAGQYPLELTAGDGRLRLGPSPAAVASRRTAHAVNIGGP